MTPSSSKWPAQPVKIQHIPCGSTWEMYAIEWPPRIAICTNCKMALQLISHDPKTKNLTYRRLL